MPRLRRSVVALSASAAALAAAAASCPSPARAAVVVHWELDESAGATAADSASAGGEQHGTSASAAPQWQPAGGILGGALRFTPTGQTDVNEAVTHTSTTNLIASSYPFTIATWVRTSASVSYREGFTFLGNQATGSQYAQTSKDPNNASPPSRAAAAARNTNFFAATGGPALSDNAWHHVVGVYTSATSRAVYVDGILGNTNATNVAAFPTTRFAIGALMRDSPTDSFNGLLDDVGLWDEALTPARVALVNGLGRAAGVVLDDPAIDQVQAVFTAQTGSATAGPYQWQYATGLGSTTVGTTGTIGGDPFIVLDASGNGVRGVPEPGISSMVAAAAAGLLSARRRRPKLT